MYKWLVPLWVLCSLSAVSANEIPVTIGDWRIFNESTEGFTATLAAQDNSANLDFFCQGEQAELSFYLKKRPEDGELTEFTVWFDENMLAQDGWSVNSRTRSALVKMSDNLVVTSLITKKQVKVEFAFQHKLGHTAIFSLLDFLNVYNTAISVCKIR